MKLGTRNDLGLAFATAVRRYNKRRRTTRSLWAWFRNDVRFDLDLSVTDARSALDGTHPDKKLVRKVRAYVRARWESKAHRDRLLPKIDLEQAMNRKGQA